MPEDEIARVVLAEFGTTSNVAEFRAAQETLTLALQHSISRLMVCGDSRLVADAMNHRAQIKPESFELVPHFNTLVALSREFERIEFMWVPRRLNRRADRASKRALAKMKAGGQPSPPARNLQVLYNLHRAKSIIFLLHLQESHFNR